MDVLIFLDLDDVVCLNDPIGGYDALEAIHQIRRNAIPMGNFQKDVWDRLFDKACVANLLKIHNEFNPTWVISSSWRRFFNRDVLCDILNASGLGFVANRLHTDWDTPAPTRLHPQHEDDRAGEIETWLRHHPEVTNWFVLDDELSGTGFRLESRKHMLKRAVMCKAQVGFQTEEYLQLRLLLCSCCSCP